MAKKLLIEEDNTPSIDAETVKALYEYHPDVQWLSRYLGIEEGEIMAQWGEFLALLGKDRNKNVEFCLYYLATVKKDIRAILAWLEAYDPTKYGKGASAADDWGNIKLEILAHLAANLPR